MLEKLLKKMNDSEEDLPLYKGLQGKVELIESYLKTSGSILKKIPELTKFVNMVRTDLEKIKGIEAKEFCNQDDVRELSILEVKILTCFNYFESGYHLYIRGNSSDFPHDYKYNMGYVGSMSTILSVLNTMANTSLRNCQYGREWCGFVTFSNTLSFTAAAASIIVLPFFARHSVELISIWTMLCHELGHVFFWDHPLIYGTNSRDQDISEISSSIMDEYFADFFALERVYNLDIAHFYRDFRTIRAHHQNPLSSLSFDVNYEERLIGSLLYTCARLNGHFKENLLESITTLTDVPQVITAFLVCQRELIIDIIGQSHERWNGPDRDLIPKLFDEGFLNVWREKSTRIHSTSSDIPQQVNEELGILEFIYYLVNNEDVEFSKIIRNKESIDILYPIYNDLAMRIADGEIISAKIEAPFLLLKMFLNHCEKKSIRLEQESFGYLRAAFILSLYNSDMHGAPIGEE